MVLSKLVLSHVCHKKRTRSSIHILETVVTDNSIIKEESKNNTASVDSNYVILFKGASKKIFYLLDIIYRIINFAADQKPKLIPLSINIKLNMASDREIWAKFKLGDDQSFNLIYAQNSEKLYLFGLKFTSNHTIIEDCIQDLFSDLFRNRKKLGDVSNIYFYLLKSFKRNLLRKLQKEKRYYLKDNDEVFVFDITYSIEQEIIHAESANQKINALRQAINLLSPRQKEAIYLRFTEEMEYQEIAEIMDMSIESCRNSVYKAIKSLKKALHVNIPIFFFFTYA